VGAETADYVLGHSEHELDRLTVQARAFQAFTRELFTEAGLQEGMRVLEIGSGNGDVALLAAEFVGPTGEVIGVEQSPDAVKLATERTRSRGLENVSFICAKIDDDLPNDREFDALVGRLVLMYLPTPAVTLRRLVRHLRPGALVAFQEINILGARAVPATPTIELAQTWIREAFLQSGVDIQTGPKLHGLFKAAGLPPPEMRVDGLISGSEGIGPALMTDVIRTILPLIEQLGLATESEVDIATLEDRMRAELEAVDGTLSSPLLVGAWSRASG
jgi:ubiquinone/menaquinone biosynthesis C-methylase UbiE